MKEQDELLDFAEVVEMFQTTPRTLRYYEYLELIDPMRDGRARYYSKREIGRLRLIFQGKRFGFKLEEIRQMLELYNPQGGNLEQLRVLANKADAQLEELRARYAELGKVIEDLERIQEEAEAQISRKTQIDAT